MIRAATFAVIAATGLLATCVAAAPSRDGATIVDSGSTNTAGYRIDVWSDGTATVVVQNRAGAAQSAPKSFTVLQKLASRFFADLKAVREGKATSQPCMKSASFGTTTRVHWHEWTSPDLDCPGDNRSIAALVSDADAIRSASGVESMLLRRGLPLTGPPHVEITP